MRRLTRSGTGAILGLWLAFTPLWLFLPTRILFEVLNGLCVATCVGVFVTFWSSVWAILAKPVRGWQASDMLILSILIASVGLAGTFTTAWVYRHTGNIDFAEGWISAVSRWIVITALSMLVVASGSDHGRIPPQAYRRAGIVAALGCAAAIILISIGL